MVSELQQWQSELQQQGQQQLQGACCPQIINKNAYRSVDLFFEKLMTIELWKPIKGFEDYEISSLGQVRRGMHIKKQRTDKKGYLSVVLWNHQKQTTCQVSRLVAAAFIGERPEGMVVRHKNGINNINFSDNLEYGTPEENEADKIRHGTNLHGEKHHQSKLTLAQVNEIRARYKAGDKINGCSALASEFGVVNSVISSVVHRKTWITQ